MPKLGNFSLNLILIKTSTNNFQVKTLYKDIFEPKYNVSAHEIYFPYKIRIFEYQAGFQLVWINKIKLYFVLDCFYLQILVVQIMYLRVNAIFSERTWFPWMARHFHRHESELFQYQAR